MHAEARLSLAQRYRIAKARSLRLLKEWDEGKHPRVPAGSPDGGQFGSGGGGAEGASKPSGGKSKKPAKKEDFDKAKINISAISSDIEPFINKWNEKIGIEPEEFKKGFMGGNDGTMNISPVSGGSKFRVTGDITSGDAEGQTLGTYEREINIDGKEAYSAYFKLNKSSTKHDIGKKMLAGNVETYKKLGIEKVGVTANIDVGGYAWAKYGYVPTQNAWNSLRSSLERKLTGGGSSSASSRPHSGNTMEADSWEMLGSDVQDDVRDRWMRDSYEEFLSSEVQNWRDSGQAKNDAQNELAYRFKEDSFVPDWASESFDKSRADRKEAGLPDFPYTNQQLFAAIDLKFESYHGDGSDKPEISFDDDQLRKPQGVDPNQMELPGIEPPDLSKHLTEQMRDEISTDLMNAFDDKAESDADDMDPPSYLAEGVGEYQEQYWDQKDDDEKLQHAIDYGMADIEIEPDEEDDSADDGLGLNPELFPPEPPAEDPLLAAVRSSDPKSIWKVADSPQGKSLLLGTNWSGVLNLKDKESMDRFNKYVGKNA